MNRSPDFCGGSAFDLDECPRFSGMNRQCNYAQQCRMAPSRDHDPLAFPPDLAFVLSGH